MKNSGNDISIFKEINFKYDMKKENLKSFCIKMIFLFHKRILYLKVKSMNIDQKPHFIADRINKIEFLSYSFQDFPKPQRL